MRLIEFYQTIKELGNSSRRNEVRSKAVFTGKIVFQHAGSGMGGKYLAAKGTHKTALPDNVSDVKAR